MKKTTLILFYALFLIFNSCTHEVSKKNISKDLPCHFVDLAIPIKYNKDYDYANSNKPQLPILNTAWYKKHAKDIITIPISENTDIDSVIVILQNYDKELLKDSINMDQCNIVYLKIPKYPLNIITRLVCRLSRTEGKWLYTFSGEDEIRFLFINQNNPRIIQHENERKDFLETLKEDESWTSKYAGRYSFITSSDESIIRYLIESDTIIHYNWNDNVSLTLKIENLEKFIIDFKNKYEHPLNGSTKTECKRNAIKIEIADNIPLKEVLEIISLSRKYELPNQVDCVNNYIIICTEVQ